MHVFLAGVMQGSRQDHLIDSQNYRVRIAQALEAHLPDVKITDPWSLNPESVDYNLAQARQTFESMTSQAAEADVLIAYLPEASMGTAIEMWTAFNAGTTIIAVTPLQHNWVVRLTADTVLPDLDTLLSTIETGRFPQLLTKDGQLTTND